MANALSSARASLSSAEPPAGSRKARGPRQRRQGRSDRSAAPRTRLDFLTGLPDRYSLEKQLTAALDQQATPSALLILDLARFKSVNDTLGHAAGDALLRTVAARLRSVLRPDDFLARIGADEFGIFLDAVGKSEDAAALAERLVRLVGRTYIVEGAPVTVGLSIGLAMTEPGTIDGAALMRQADLALYAAKADGRATYRFFEPDMQARAEARRTLEFELRKALMLDEFELEYQPQVTTTSGRISGVEALLRWRHPRRGRVPPGEFVPLAEELGLLSAIGEWVLRQACRAAIAWPENISIAVNLSPAQFRCPDLVDQVRCALTESGLSPSRLELEITETLLLHDNATNIAILHRLRDLGVRIAMDDFGTGYSSLSYLLSFPFDKIKIDRCFVRELGSKPHSAMLIRAITTLSRSLGMRTTVEGVETLDELHKVQAEGCTDVQGFVFSRPVAPSSITDLLARGFVHPADADAEPSASCNPSQATS